MNKQNYTHKYYPKPRYYCNLGFDTMLSRIRFQATYNLTHDPKSKV